MIVTCTLVGSLIGFDSVGVKGFTAGVGIVVIFNKSKLFILLNKLFKRNE